MRPVLIGPCGIETYFGDTLNERILVLIGPCGIETKLAADAATLADTVLIGPCGIETELCGTFCFLLRSINWTLRN